MMPLTLAHSQSTRNIRNPLKVLVKRVLDRTKQQTDRMKQERKEKLKVPIQ